MTKLGTVCHNGHPMQATYETYIDIQPDGTVTRQSQTFIKADFGPGPYCAEDCDDIPDEILKAATDILYDDGARII